MFPYLGGLLKGLDKTLKLTNANLSEYKELQAVDVSATLSANGNLILNADTGGGGHANEWMHDSYAGSAGFNPALYEGGYFGSFAGDPPSGTLNQYISLDLSPSWGYSRGSGQVGSNSCTGTLRVREKADTGNEVTCTLTMYAEVGSGE